MSEKFFDIIPPEKAKEPAKISAPQKIQAGKEKKPLRGSGTAKKKKKTVFFKLLFLVVLFLVLAAIPGFFLFSKSKIEIWPKTKILTLEETVVVSLEPEDGQIAGKSFKDQRSGSQEFPASLKVIKEEKAKGKIIVYNSYSSAPQPLLANTRFVSADAKLFRSIKREVIAGASGNTAGETEIEVEAAEPGEEYNIGPSTFSIPGFAGTPKYTAFYGKSFSQMTGGFKGEAAKVTQDDLDKAKEVLAEKLKEESRQFMKSALPQGFVLLDRAILTEISGESHYESVDSFTLELEVLSESVIFRESDIESFVQKIIGLNISENEKFQKESLEISYFPIEISSERIDLNLKIKAKIYSDIDLDNLKRSLSGKSLQEIKVFLENRPEIDKSEINLGPFWRKRLPSDIEDIKAVQNLD